MENLVLKVRILSLEKMHWVTYFINPYMLIILLDYKHVRVDRRVRKSKDKRSFEQNIFRIMLMVFKDNGATISKSHNQQK